MQLGVRVYYLYYFGCLGQHYNQREPEQLPTHHNVRSNGEPFRQIYLKHLRQPCGLAVMILIQHVLSVHSGVMLLLRVHLENRSQHFHFAAVLELSQCFFLQRRCKNLR